MLLHRDSTEDFILSRFEKNYLYEYVFRKKRYD